jgi:hypothetical protein
MLGHMSCPDLPPFFGHLKWSVFRVMSFLSLLNLPLIDPTSESGQLPIDLSRPVVCPAFSNFDFE